MAAGKISARESLGSFIFSEDTFPPSQSQSQSFSQVEGMESNPNIDFEHSTGSSQSGGASVPQNKDNQSQSTSLQEQKASTSIPDKQQKALDSHVEPKLNTQLPIETFKSNPDTRQDSLYFHSPKEVSARPIIQPSFERNPSSRNESNKSLESWTSKPELSSAISTKPISIYPNTNLSIANHASHVTFSSVESAATVNIRPQDTLHHKCPTEPNSISSQVNTGFVTPTPTREGSIVQGDSSITTFNPHHTLGLATPRSLQASQQPTNLNPHITQLPIQNGYNIVCYQSLEKDQMVHNMSAPAVSQGLQKVDEHTRMPLNGVKSDGITSFQALLAAPELPGTVLDTLQSPLANQNSHTQVALRDTENLHNYSDEELFNMIAVILKDPEFPLLKSLLSMLTSIITGRKGGKIMGIEDYWEFLRHCKQVEARKLLLTRHAIVHTLVKWESSQQLYNR
ncbi:hypothetical protein K493DRAFT_301556 [Basidiobolus meristosporus CBS 931.73]|uniref:Uncharacterized protein n=1 Tax=Basidiobolus meristosporus CBS 931.73 TaxID=1314790 RepID=A0A1Y1YBD7_9FUNG|nr:hypothetical protein K493DRAFT_301556 [Basidiobolus meristosporus CBS 931.73]|eukprot:ORX95297.1 hypothetical protein K493DRAFT_301556 [Basidiobolus meristosporus CBS 931.73]